MGQAKTQPAGWLPVDRSARAASDRSVLPAYDLDGLAARLARRGMPPEADRSGRQAAVAAILRAPAGGGDAEILLMRRADREGDPWSGHMAFPGGRRDAGDTSLTETAIRETREEVGLDLALDGALLARLPDVPAIARGKRLDLVIAPLVFALQRRAALTLNEEVAEAIWTPLGPLARGEGAGTVTYDRDGLSVDLPCLRVEGRVVWGLTYRMLQLLFEALHTA